MTRPSFSASAMRAATASMALTEPVTTTSSSGGRWRFRDSSAFFRRATSSRQTSLTAAFLASREPFGWPNADSAARRTFFCVVALPWSCVMACSTAQRSAADSGDGGGAGAGGRTGVGVGAGGGRVT